MERFKEKKAPMLTKLKQLLGPDHWNSLVFQAQDRDIEWAIDLMQEAIDGITSESKYWIPEYHKTIILFTTRELHQMQKEWVRWCTEGWLNKDKIKRHGKRTDQIN